MMTRRSLLFAGASQGLTARKTGLSEPEIRRLLNHVAGVYSQGATDASVRVRVTSEWADDLTVGPELEYILHRSGNFSYLEMRQLTHVLYIVGASRIWHYRFDSREYIESELSSQRANEVRKIGRDWFFDQLDRFLLLPKVEANLTFLAWDNLRKASASRRCSVIRLKPVDPSQSWWQERMWIEPETGIIWKLIREFKGGVRNRTYHMPGTAITNWDSVVLGEPPDPELFVFHPPKDARLVRKFSVYTGH